ncbi:MAG: APC family permease [Gulosibacter sp.]|uniref:APC family permease n=1 Tax=Gulosibacter sp. TaxID=2817531 RepID=UPI003F90EB94
MSSVPTRQKYQRTEHQPERRLGVLSIAFMIVAASAPLTAIAGGAPTSFAVTGLATVPAGYIVLSAILALFAFGYAAMARFIERPGAFYPYVAQGLGRSIGVGTAYAAVVAYNMMQIGIFAMFGFTVSSWLGGRFGLETPWWLWVLVGVVIVGILGILRIDFSAKIIAVLVALEFLVVIVFDIIALVVAPEGHSAAPLNPAELFVPGIGAVLSFGVAAFMGFESAAIYAREAKDPKRTVGRATFLAVIVVGLFYAFSAWSMVVGVGHSQVVDQSREFGPDLLFVFLSTHAGTLVTDIANLLFITSLFAALQAFHNTVARYFAELGNEGMLPHWFGRRSQSGAPVSGSLAQSALAVLVTIGFVIADSGDPLFPVLTMFTWLTNTGAFGLVMLMAMVAAAVIAYFAKDARGVGLFSRLIAPVIAGLALTTVFILVLVNFPVLMDMPADDFMTYLLPILVILAGVIGVVVGQIFKRTDPKKFQGIGHALEEETDPGALTSATTTHTS